MKLLIYSDVHLERQRFTPGPRALEADPVVMAGDIDRHGVQRKIGISAMESA